MTITPEFLFDLESNMRLISETEYKRLTKNLWWQRVAKRMDSKSKKERINWLLETAKIERTIKGGGQVKFEDIVSRTTEFEVENAAAGLLLKKEELEDLDGNGVNLAAHWSKQMGAYATYWPQQEVAKAILANPTTYDDLDFFHEEHPLNPYDPGIGTYANDFTGAADGIYPGALPIDDSVSVEQAIKNLAKAIAYVASIKSPNGRTPRGLRLSAIMVPPALMARAVQITSAKFIAQAANSAAGSADVEALIRYIGLGVPVQCDEFASTFENGSDTTYYLVMEEITSNELGAFVYVDREPFAIIYHGPQTDAQLARMRVFQWTTEGRNIVGAGHPYLLFRCQKT